MIVFQTESRTRMSQIVRECHALLRDIQRTDAREVVAYKNRTSRGLFREEVEAHLLYGR